jgi:hypothetical protein
MLTAFERAVPLVTGRTGNQVIIKQHLRAIQRPVVTGPRTPKDAHKRRLQRRGHVQQGCIAGDNGRGLLYECCRRPNTLQTSDGDQWLRATLRQSREDRGSQWQFAQTAGEDDVGGGLQSGCHSGKLFHRPALGRLACAGVQDNQRQSVPVFTLTLKKSLR